MVDSDYMIPGCRLGQEMKKGMLAAYTPRNPTIALQSKASTDVPEIL